MNPITFTFDIEDHRPSPTWETRYATHTRRVLDFLDERGIRATMFVVGRLAQHDPALIREVAERGHEVGLHNFEHWALFSCLPGTFGSRVARAKDEVEQLIGREVAGFRAPAGTLVPSTYWVTQVLAEVGFVYSASTLPVQTYGVGFPGCPEEPFRWPSGLIESPSPHVGLGEFGLPLMGGTFLRVLPMQLVRSAADRLPSRTVPWIYAHPYDIDALEPFWFVRDVQWWGSILLWVNRGRMLGRVERLLEGRIGQPLGERLAALDAAGEIAEWVPDNVVEAPEEMPPSRRVVWKMSRALRLERQRRDLSPPPHLVEPRQTGDEMARAAAG